MNTQSKSWCTKVLSILLAIFLLLSMIPTAVFAAEADTSAPQIISYNWALDGILRANFKVDAKGQSMDAYSLRVQIGSDASAQTITNYSREDELYTYTANVMAHRLGESMTVSLMSGETVVQTSQKTIDEYVDAQKKAYPADTALHGLLDAMVSYGKYAAFYKGTNPAQTPDPDVEAVTAADLAQFAHTVSGDGISSLGAMVALYLDDACDMVVKLDASAAQDHTLYVDGVPVAMELTGDRFVYTLEELLPQDWDKFYSIEVKNAQGESVLAIEYSVLSYIRAVLNRGDDAALAGLLKSMYLYWSKVEGYIASNAPVDQPQQGITLPVTTADDVITEPVAFENIFIPAGVKVDPGRKTLTVTIVQKAASDSDLAATENKTLSAYDVHIEGIAADNTVPVQVELTEVLPKNLNSSALQLGHVENGKTVPMAYVASNGALTAHNQFRYDPATGSVVLAMASFSEIALLADLTNPWDGAADKAWYNTTDAEFVIRNAQQLAGFAQIVAEGTDFAGKTVSLAADIDLSGHMFYPIGFWTEKTEESFGQYGGGFSGTFDGTGHTIKNLTQNGWEMNGEYTNGDFNEAMGLFGYLCDATVQNLNLDSIKIKMEYACMGGIASVAEGNCAFKNIAVTNADMSSCNTACAGILGCDIGDNSNFTFENITVDATNTFRALWGVYDTMAAGILGLLQTESSADFVNCHVSAVLDVYNDYCGNYQWGIYRYSGMFVGAVKKTAAEGDRKVCDLSNITATGCTVNFGDWHDSYYYCEFEKNGHPSYAGENDYKYSRVPLEDITVTDGVAVCNHKHTEAEDGRAVQFAFDSVFGSYGNWGVNPVQANAYDGINIVDTSRSDQKFEAAVTGTAEIPYAVNEGTELAVGSLFAAIEGKTINTSGVYVSITKVNQDDTVSGTYTADTDTWENGILTFTGSGTIKLTIQDYQLCTPTELYVNITAKQSVEKFELVFENTDKYLYRVGNANAVALSSLFRAVDGAEIDAANVTVTVEKLDEATNVAGTFTANSTDWTQGKIQFTGTGPVELTITDEDYCEPLRLKLEVVDAKNATTAASATANNVVLLNDVSGGFSVSDGYTFYGNGFTVTDTRKDTSGSTAWIEINNGYVNNAILMCQDYPEAVVSGTAKQYYSPAVKISNGGGIYNSYVNGGRYAIMVGSGDIEIINTTITGGAVANMNVGSTGTLLLKDVTTVQRSGVTNPPYGMAIAVSSGDKQITIEGEFNQYNWALSSDIPSSYSNIFSDLYTSSSYSNIQYNNGGKTYINTGIFFFQEGETLDGSNLTNAKGANSFVIDGKTYTKVEKTALEKTAICYSYDTSVNAAPTNLLTYGSYITVGQYSIPPAFDYNVTADNADNRHYAYYDADAGCLRVGFEAESTAGYIWTPTPLANKNGNALAVTVQMNDVDYTGKSITFNTVGEYEVVYTYVDPSNYDKTGEKYAVTYSKTLKVIVSAVERDAQNAEFTFYDPTGTSYPSKVVVMNGKNYVMPDVSATTSGKIMSKTIDGVTVYAPYVECLFKDNSNDFNFIYPLLTGVNVVDYPDGVATGYNKNTTADDFKAKFTVITGTDAWNPGIGADNRAMSIEQYNDSLCIVAGKDGSDNDNTQTVIGEFSFTDNTGKVFYYCVYYNIAAHDAPSCVTPDTLITMADGTQKEVQYLTAGEELLVWNMFTGDFDTAPVLFINTHDNLAKETDVIHLTFSDDTVVKVIAEHAFFDTTLNQYVYLDKNASEYIGHSFNKQIVDESGNFTYTDVQLVDVAIKTEVTTAYQPVTYGYLNCYVNGMLSMPGDINGMFNYFAVDPETMKYDEAAMQADIEKYGILTYEEFAEYFYPSELMYDAIGAKYVKVTVGKGLTTMEELKILCERYKSFFIE